MPPAIIAAGIGAAGSVAAGAIGAGAAGGQRDQATQAVNQAVAAIQSTGLPPNIAAPLLIQKMKAAGTYTPQMEQYINAGASQAAKVGMNPAIQQAQMQALQLIQQRGTTGLGPQDIAAINQIQQQAASQAKGQRDSILQNMQARGQSGSGAELAAELAASQAGTNQASNQSLQVAGQASQNALQALAASGNLGTQMQQQGLNLGLSQASAEDQMQRFNTQNQIQQNAANTQMANQGNLYNLSVGQQDIANQNAELQRQAAAQQQMYQDTLAQNQAVANAQLGKASNLQQQAAATAQGANQVGAGIAGIAGQVAGGLLKNPNALGGGGGGGSDNSNPAGLIGTDENGSLGNKYSLFGN